MSKKYLFKYNYSNGSNSLELFSINYIINLYKLNRFRILKILLITFNNKNKIKIIKYLIKVVHKLSKKNNHKYLVANKIHNILSLSFKEIQNKSLVLLRVILKNYKKIPIYNIGELFNKTFKEKYFYYKNKNLLTTPKNIHKYLDHIYSNKNINHKYIKDYIYKINLRGYYKIEKIFKQKINFYLNIKDFFKKKELSYNNKILSRFIKKKKKIKKKIKKIKNLFFNLLKKNNININSFIYKDINNLFQLDINFDVMKNIVLMNKNIINNRLKKNLINNNFFSKKVNIKEKEKIGYIKKKIKSVIYKYSNLIKKSSFNYVLYSKIIEFYIYKIYFIFTINNNKPFELYKNIPTKEIINLYNKFNHIYIYEFHYLNYKDWRILKIILNNFLFSGYKINLWLDFKKKTYNGFYYDFPRQIKFKSYKHNIVSDKYLKKNYKSDYFIVIFNNSLFNFITNKYIKNKEYKKIYENSSIQLPKKKDSGYVEINILRNKNNKYTSILNSIKKLLLNGSSVNDIVILLNNQLEVYKYINNLTLHNYIIPNIIFKTNVYLNDSIYVKILIEFMKVLVYNNIKNKVNIILYLNQIYKKKIKIKNIKNIKKFFIYLNNNHINISYKRLLELSIFEKIQYISEKIKITNNFLGILLDIVYNFEIDNYNNLYGFLNFWSKNKNKYTVNKYKCTNVIRILSIKTINKNHKIVILPLFSLNIFYNKKKIINDIIINKVKSLKDFNEYINKKEIDYFNILYNLTTRAKNKLIIFLLKTINKNNIYNLFKSFFKNNNLWNNKIKKLKFGKNYNFLNTKNIITKYNLKNKIHKLYLQNTIENISSNNKNILNNIKYILKKFIKKKFIIIKDNYFFINKKVHYNTIALYKKNLYIIETVNNKKKIKEKINIMYQKILLSKLKYKSISNYYFIILNKNFFIQYIYKV